MFTMLKSSTALYMDSAITLSYYNYLYDNFSSGTPTLCFLENPSRLPSFTLHTIFNTV